MYKHQKDLGSITFLLGNVAKTETENIQILLIRFHLVNKARFYKFNGGTKMCIGLVKHMNLNVVL